MIRLALAQVDFPVGAMGANRDRALECIGEAREGGADLVLFPELALTGYPPEDLLLRPGFMRRTHEVLDDVVRRAEGIDAVVGHPRTTADGTSRRNSVSWIRDTRVIGRYDKQVLPNYAVFDERRYFSSGSDPLVVEIGGCRIGVVICEDSWEPGPARQAREAGARMLLIPNASPYRDDKHEARLGMLRERNRETGLPIAYCNLVGGQDELVFDGRCLLVDADGTLHGPGPLCDEALLFADFDPESGRFSTDQWPEPPTRKEAEIYAVLERGLGDYARKNGFREVVFGLSGGIDSALTLALAADVFGPRSVHAVMMPSEHTSGLSLELAERQANMLGVDYRVIPIEEPVRALESALAPSFDEVPPDVTEENLQARVRGNLVMALSNKFGWLPLATSNKSELAVGYATIYGDMCGGFAPLKDCLKTRVYELAQWRNSVSDAIPAEVIRRPPSAELAPGQLDQDRLPEYETLDEVLHRFVDLDRSIHDIVADGYDEGMVRFVAGLVLGNEYKRRQGAPGTRITSRGFGRDRRYPITSGWREEA